jgi:DNA-binding NtrC family response regulator
MEESEKEFNKDVKGFSPDVMKTLLDYHWPGNVRELKNTVRRAVLPADSDKITETCLTL